jgi:hypothetical protein
MAIKGLHTAQQLLIIPAIDEHLVHEADTLLVAILIAYSSSTWNGSQRKNACGKASTSRHLFTTFKYSLWIPFPKTHHGS